MKDYAVKYILKCDLSEFMNFFVSLEKEFNAIHYISDIDNLLNNIIVILNTHFQKSSYQIESEKEIYELFGDWASMGIADCKEELDVLNSFVDIASTRRLIDNKEGKFILIEKEEYKENELSEIQAYLKALIDKIPFNVICSDIVQKKVIEGTKYDIDEIDCSIIVLEKLNLLRKYFGEKSFNIEEIIKLNNIVIRHDGFVSSVIRFLEKNDYISNYHNEFGKYYLTIEGMQKLKQKPDSNDKRLIINYLFNSSDNKIDINQ